MKTLLLSTLALTALTVHAAPPANQNPAAAQGQGKSPAKQAAPNKHPKLEDCPDIKIDFDEDQGQDGPRPEAKGKKEDGGKSPQKHVQGGSKSGQHARDAGEDLFERAQVKDEHVVSNSDSILSTSTSAYPLDWTISKWWKDARSVPTAPTSLPGSPPVVTGTGTSMIGAQPMATGTGGAPYPAGNGTYGYAASGSGSGILGTGVYRTGGFGFGTGTGAARMTFATTPAIPAVEAMSAPVGSDTDGQPLTGSAATLGIEAASATTSASSTALTTPLVKDRRDSEPLFERKWNWRKPQGKLLKRPKPYCPPSHPLNKITGKCEQDGEWLRVYNGCPRGKKWFSDLQKCCKKRTGIGKKCEKRKKSGSRGGMSSSAAPSSEPTQGSGAYGSGGASDQNGHMDNSDVQQSEQQSGGHPNDVSGADQDGQGASHQQNEEYSNDADGKYQEGQDSSMQQDGGLDDGSGSSPNNDYQNFAHPIDGSMDGGPKTRRDDEGSTPPLKERGLRSWFGSSESKGRKKNCPMGMAVDLKNKCRAIKGWIKNFRGCRAGLMFLEKEQKCCKRATGFFKGCKKLPAEAYQSGGGASSSAAPYPSSTGQPGQQGSDYPPGQGQGGMNSLPVGNGNYPNGAGPHQNGMNDSPNQGDNYQDGANGQQGGMGDTYGQNDGYSNDAGGQHSGGQMQNEAYPDDGQGAGGMQDGGSMDDGSGMDTGNGDNGDGSGIGDPYGADDGTGSEDGNAHPDDGSSLYSQDQSGADGYPADDGSGSGQYKALRDGELEARRRRKKPYRKDPRCPLGQKWNRRRRKCRPDDRYKKFGTCENGGKWNKYIQDCELPGAGSEPMDPTKPSPQCQRGQYFSNKKQSCKPILGYKGNKPCPPKTKFDYKAERCTLSTQGGSGETSNQQGNGNVGGYNQHAGHQDAGYNQQGGDRDDGGGHGQQDDSMNGYPDDGNDSGYESGGDDMNGNEPGNQYNNDNYQNDGSGSQDGYGDQGGDEGYRRRHIETQETNDAVFRSHSEKRHTATITTLVTLTRRAASSDALRAPSSTKAGVEVHSSRTDDGQQRRHPTVSLRDEEEASDQEETPTDSDTNKPDNCDPAQNGWSKGDSEWLYCVTHQDPGPEVEMDYEGMASGAATVGPENETPETTSSESASSEETNSETLNPASTEVTSTSDTAEPTTTESDDNHGNPSDDISDDIKSVVSQVASWVEPASITVTDEEKSLPTTPSSAEYETATTTSSVTDRMLSTAIESVSSSIMSEMSSIASNSMSVAGEAAKTGLATMSIEDTAPIRRDEPDDDQDGSGGLGHLIHEVVEDATSLAKSVYATVTDEGKTIHTSASSVVDGQDGTVTITSTVVAATSSTRTAEATRRDTPHLDQDNQVDAAKSMAAAIAAEATEPAQPLTAYLLQGVGAAMEGIHLGG